jgi:hypothetical protein
VQAQATASAFADAFAQVSQCRASGSAGGGATTGGGCAALVGRWLFRVAVHLKLLKRFNHAC